MRNQEFQSFAPEKCWGYRKIFEMSIGGFLYLAFLPGAYYKIICISSEYISLIDSETGQVLPLEGDYDEEALLVMCEGCEAPIPIAGQYGGSLPLFNEENVQVTEINSQSEDFPLVTIYWEAENQIKTQIYKGYQPYIFGFSPDGQYYVHVDDGGLIVLKKAVSNVEKCMKMNH